MERSVAVSPEEGGLFSLGEKQPRLFSGKKGGPFGLWFQPPDEPVLGKGDIYFPDYDSCAWSASSVWLGGIIDDLFKEDREVKTKHAAGDWKYASSGGGGGNRSQRGLKMQDRTRD